MQNDDLMPCPFCGGEAEEATAKMPTGECYLWVQCRDCGAMSECCNSSDRHNNPDEPDPIDLWNTRTAHSGEGRSNGAGEDVTNGQFEDDDFSPAADLARHIASYCEGEARKNVYRVAKNALSAPQGEMEQEGRVRKYLSDERAARARLATFPEGVKERLAAWQEGKSEWFSSTVLEIVAEFMAFDDNARSGKGAE